MDVMMYKSDGYCTFAMPAIHITDLGLMFL